MAGKVQERGRGTSIFFITDQLEKGNVSIKYCPTTKMKADYFTKALQGNIFKQLRKEILTLLAAGHSMLMQMFANFVFGYWSAGVC